MRILGIDYGSKRIGVAVSDEAGKFALPLIVLQNSPTITDAIEEIAKNHAVNQIVIGESRDYSGKPNSIFAAATALKNELEKQGFTIHWEPEFMTSAHAEKLQGKHDKIDASAAALILQSYLDRKV